MIKYLVFFLILLNTTICYGYHRQEVDNWQQIISVEDLWENEPGRLRILFNELNFQYPGLEPAGDLLAKGDTIGAGEFLVNYYRNTDRSWIITTIERPEYTDIIRVADALESDSVILKDLPVKIPISSDGGWQWNFTGPDKDDEFGYSLNGHRYMLTLLVASQETGNKTYAKVFDQLIKDWIIHHPLPAEDDSIYVVLDPTKYIDWRDIGEVEWRTLQAGQRLGAVWPQAFYSFQADDEFSSASRLLMLSSISEQAGYLRKYHKVGHNWTTMEMNGLALAGLAFPEFKNADDWANYALEVMSNEINRQVYPDGVQTEISTKTQWVALHRFESVAENFKKANRQITDAYLERLEEMYNYLAYCMRPDGHQPLNSDSDREDLRERVLIASKKFDRPDWQWIATNGKAGDIPTHGPSLSFPWAGIHISRSGWDEAAAWSFFDFGPYGTGHQHRDKLHISVAAFGKDLLVDGGRYTHQDYFSFDPSVWRGYFRSSFSHNVILVNEKGQNAGATRMRNPLVEGEDYVHNTEFDYAFGVFRDGYEEVEGTAIHSRSVLYLKNNFWLVLDHFETDQPRELQVLWHYAPDCKVIVEENEVVSVNPSEANLRIIPIGKLSWITEIIKGQEEPIKQGWYSADYGIKLPNPTVIYSAKILETTSFAWLLAPADGEVPEFNIQSQEVAGSMIFSISQEGHDPIQISMPIKKDISKVKVNLN